VTESQQTLNGIFPIQPYSYHVGAGRKGNELVNYLSVRLYPVRYNTQQQTLVYAHTAEIQITYELPETPITFEDDYDLIIIAPEKFKKNLQPLVEHKNSYNVTTLLVTLDEIYGGEYFPLEGRDCAEEIKYFIKNAYDEWGIKYVLLVGGRKGGLFEEKWWVPVRYSHLHDGSDEHRFLTDLYFSDIYDAQGNFSSWDTDDDGIFAEWTLTDKDILEMYPDVYVGRLGAVNLLDVRFMVNKIITYESSAYGTDWVKQYVGVAGDTYPSPGDPYFEGELANEASYDYIESMGYESDYVWTSESYTEKSDVLNRVSEGCGFLHFSGHGSHWSWATHPPQDSNTWISGPNAFDMMDLTNKEKQPIVLVGGCHNAQFNTSLANMILGILGQGMGYFSTEPPIGGFWYRKWIPKCWSQSMANRMNKGCIGIIANSGYGYGISGEDCLTGRGRFMEIQFFRSFSEGTMYLGDTHGMDLTYYMNEFPPMEDEIDCKIAQQWVLLGDPSLMIGGYSE
jgi:hypothetical protein